MRMLTRKTWNRQTLARLQNGSDSYLSDGNSILRWKLSLERL